MELMESEHIIYFPGIFDDIYTVVIAYVSAVEMVKCPGRLFFPFHH